MSHKGMSNEEATRQTVQPVLATTKEYRIAYPDLFSYDSLKPELDALKDEEPELTAEEALERIIERKETTMYTTSEAALYLMMKRDSMRNLLADKQIVATKGPGEYGRWSVSEAALDEYAHREVKQRRPSAKVEGYITEERTGYVSAVQAAHYLGRDDQYVRHLYREGVIKGLKMGYNKVVLDMESVKEYKRNLKNNRYNPQGYVHFLVLTEDDMKHMQAIGELGLPLIQIQFRIPDDETFQELKRMGLKPLRKTPKSDQHIKRSPLSLPERYQALLEKAQLEDEGFYKK